MAINDYHHSMFEQHSTIGFVEFSARDRNTILLRRNEARRDSADGQGPSRCINVVGRASRSSSRAFAAGGRIKQGRLARNLRAAPARLASIDINSRLLIPITYELVMQGLRKRGKISAGQKLVWRIYAARCTADP